MDTFSSKDDSGIKTKRMKLECNYGERCYRKKSEHFDEYEHPHLTRLLLLMDESETLPLDYKPKISSLTLKEQLQIVRDLQTGNEIHEKIVMIDNQVALPSSSTEIPKIVSNEPPKQYLIHKHTISQRKKHQKEIVIQREKALAKMKFSIEKKMDAAHPYNIFLTTVEDSPNTYKELLSISFLELLHPYFGELESSLQINFMVQIGFLLAQYTLMDCRCLPLTLIYGQCDVDLGDRFQHFLTHERVITPSSFGTHHTKMMVFNYKDGSIRVVVSTANLVEDDWLNRTQGIWISPKCPPLLPDADTGSGESVTNFKRDLLQYLTSYKLAALQPWLEKIRSVDMSAVKVFFVGSIPGTHTIDKNNWGQSKLGKVLSEQITTDDGRVIAQCSSIGSLGPKPISWLQSEMLSVFTSTKRKGISSPPPMSLIYPTFECVSRSYDGLLGGGCLPYGKRTHDKQKWLNSYLCDWYSENRYRTKAPPHIKSYCRISEDNKKLYYFVLTSANMSKAAWGQKSKSGSLNILSYEAGVVLVPQILIGKDYFPLVKEDDNDIKEFSLPFDIPTVSYGYSDLPWFVDNLR